ncbi:Mur ligase domain-containing protein [Reichenbachiella carrageenanivorans]|uniref:Mur ligase domain-containing protein n=1 Tax=Reichenbachiella carrageenanivorans TaxID=2979869 RepID=A0ABY6CVY1_9BACT|nr:Mur ligase domain-containing protein [Reichenbachiella carrageenanivorans]UXX78023.1 Mur ligase domain-containing protein [Reichenbachiella carrageenanivorans]
MSQIHQKIHIIAIGGAVMSSLAIALKKKGMTVSGSDDKIYDPAASLLNENGLLPTQMGWNANLIDNSLDAVIVGMHAKADNPELLKAQALGIKIWSYPAFIRSQSDDKQRIVIAGSHGKTTITGSIIHVLNYWNRDFDYVVGAKIKGIEETIKLSDAPIIVIEGDEYFTSPLDLEPKFLKYDHHIALISGTAWDHINVYPTEDSYLAQFEKLANQTPKAGSLIYCTEDAYAKKIATKERTDVKADPYETPNYKVKNGRFYLNEETPVKLFGKHNMQNLEGARTLLKRIGISRAQFYEAIASFEGAYKRNNLLSENSNTAVYTDFAHAPSKLEATANALKELHPNRNLIACYELHTFSSLNKAFLGNYKDTFKAPNEAIVFFDQKLIEEKNYTAINEEDIRKAFNRKDIQVFTDSTQLQAHLLRKDWKNQNLIFMSSGTFGGLDLGSIANTITK